MSHATDEETNFARSCQVTIELFPKALRDVLQSILDPKTLPPTVKLKGNYNNKLSADQRSIVHDLSTDGDYNRCDTSLLYILYRNLPGVSAKPTKGWGKPVSKAHVSIGDDLERIRESRNRMYGHVQVATLNNQDYAYFIQDAKDILGRFDALHGGLYPAHPNAGSYVPSLNAIDKKVMDSKVYNDFKQELSNAKKNEEDLKNRIDGMEKVQCQIQTNQTQFQTDQAKLEANQILLQNTVSNLQITIDEIKEKEKDDTVASEDEIVTHIDQDQRWKSFTHDGTNHYHCIKNTSWFTWAHHSKNQNPSTLLNFLQREEYIPKELSYQLYESGETRLYTFNDLNDKFLEKFRDIFAVDLERQPWLFTNLHVDCVENKNFYEFCKRIEKWGMHHNYSFLFVDYEYAENLKQLSCNTESLKNDMKIGNEDSKNRILLFLSEERIIFNIRYLELNPTLEDDVKKKNIIESIQKGQDDLKLFSSLYMNLLEGNEICFAGLLAVDDSSDKNIEELMVCVDCQKNLIIPPKVLHDADRLGNMFEHLISKHNGVLSGPKHLAPKDIFESLASRIWASLSVKDVHLPILSVCDQNTLVPIYLNDDQRRFLRCKYTKVILRGGYGSGKSILAQEKFKEMANSAGISDQLYYVVFSDDTIYTAMVRLCIHNSLPGHVNKNQIHILNVEEYTEKHMNKDSASLSDILYDLNNRHYGKKVVVIIDEFDGSLLTENEAVDVKNQVKKLNYVLIVVQSMEISRSKVEKDGFFKTIRTELKGHCFSMTGMELVTLDKIMRNCTKINELSSIAVRMFERHTNQYYERTLTSKVEQATLLPMDEKNNLSKTIPQSQEKDNVVDLDEKNAGRQADIRSGLSKEEITNNQKQEEAISQSAGPLVVVSSKMPRSQDPSLSDGNKKNIRGKFDHFAKVMSFHSQNYTGNKIESKFHFPGNWSHGHSVRGCTPKLIYPFLKEEIDYHNVNSNENKRRMFFAMKRIFQVDDCHQSKELAFIAFDLIDAQLLHEVLIVMQVPVILHCPALLLPSKVTIDELKDSLLSNILITDHIGARGMEFKRLVVAFNPNEIILQQYLIEAFTRAVYELFFLLVFKDVGKLKESRAKTTVCKTIIKEWLEKKVVEEEKIGVCTEHKLKDFRTVICCRKGKEFYQIHLWHEDFDICEGMKDIRELSVDASMAMKQLDAQINSNLNPSKKKPLLPPPTSLELLSEGPPSSPRPPRDPINEDKPASQQLPPLEPMPAPIPPRRPPRRPPRLPLDTTEDGDPPQLPPRESLTKYKPTNQRMSQLFVQKPQKNCFTKVFNECPLTLHCSASWKHPESELNVLLFASDEGIYSLALGDADVEMTQIFSRSCKWLYVFKNILVSICGKDSNVYMHNLINPLTSDIVYYIRRQWINLHEKREVKEESFRKPRGIAYTTKIPGTINTLKCFVAHNPYNNEMYLYAGRQDGILVLQWYEPLQKFMIVKDISCSLPPELPVFEPILRKGMDFPSICVGVYSKDNGDFLIDEISVTESDWNWQPKPSMRKVDVKSFSQLEQDLVLLAYDKCVQFIDIKGKCVNIENRFTELYFDHHINSAICLPGSVLTFNAHGVQGKALHDNEQTAHVQDTSRTYKLLCSDRIVVIGSATTNGDDASSERLTNLYILADEQP